MQTMMRISLGRVLLALALLTGWSGSHASAAELESLERGLVGQATALIKKFKAKGYKNVGVLKFLVLRADAKKFSDNVGTLNMTLARRLEVALVLANDPRNPIGIIRNASAVAARTSGANHMTKAGRLKMFEADYSLAWGKEEVKADAFVTGTAHISKDLTKLTLSLLGFDKTDNKVVELADDFVVRNDAGKLAEMGESFVLRGLFDNSEAIFTAAKVATKETRHPIADKTSPVKLGISYNGKIVKKEVRDGKVYIPEPEEGQKVTFKLTRDASDVRYGVVLKVNGENTIEKQKEPDLYCRRWILAPGIGPVAVTGYQLTDTKYQEFRVLSAAESKAKEINYGADVGTITMTVFRESKAEVVGDMDRMARNARLVAKAALPEKTPENYGALKAQLLADADRSLIGEGEVKTGTKVKRVKFKPDPTPVMTVSIIYYKR